MKNFVTALSVMALSIFFVIPLNAQDRFDRAALIPADTLSIAGFSHVVSGLDFDNDGLLEIYAANTEWDSYDLPGKDKVPRLYKYEQDGNGGWDQVWFTSLPIPTQNSWAALASADLDNDGKGEIVWGPVNRTNALNLNPTRIAVYETPGDGSDIMGVSNGDGTYRPNAQWTITDVNEANIRPFRWLINDIDNDGTDEIVTGLRGGDQRGAIYSVDDVPDAADSTETWTLEWEGLGALTHYDLAIIDNSIYYIRDNGDVTKVTYDAVGDSFIVGTPQTRLVGNGTTDGGSWKSAATIDANNDAQEEIIVASWDSGSRNVYLLQESGDTLTSTVINSPPSTSNRLYGGAAGDLDNDGNVDFVFGTRESTPNAIIHRLEYQGGAIDDANNWVLSNIDFEVSEAQQYDIVTMADLDADGEDEVVYTGVPRGLSTGDIPQPIVVLDRVSANQPGIKKIVDVPNDQGRQVWTIWQGSADDVPLGPPGAAGTIPVAVFAPEGTEFPHIEIGGKVLQPLAVGAENTNSPEGQNVISQYVVWRIDNGNPVQVATVVPIQAPLYAAVVPTLGDGMAWEGTFVVSAHTPDPLVNYKSFPQAGYSVDNLVPAAPTNVAAAPVGGDVNLSWDESPDLDFNYFSIRRGNTQGFDAADPASEVGTTTNVLFTDVAVGDGNWFYRIVAFDFNGNQGELSAEVGVVITGIEDVNSAVPAEFALHQNYPNPFNPETKITFDLPVRTDLTITIFNTLGQKVRTLFSDAKPAGSHTLLWDGSNDQGITVSSGIYIYTIQAGDFVQSRKMTFMK
jgi:hypothetical protein